LIFSVRGGKIRDVDSTINARLMNIELPANFLYFYKHIMIGAGPNFTYGIKGKLKSDEMERNAYNADESLERTLKRFEAGGNFLIGYTFKKGIFISANFLPALRIFTKEMVQHRITYVRAQGYSAFLLVICSM